MRTFECWDVDNDPERECPGRVEHLDHVSAAITYAEKRYAEDYPQTQRVAVREVGGTRVAVFDVHAEPSVEFRAVVVEEPGA